MALQQQFSFDAQNDHCPSIDLWTSHIFLVVVQNVAHFVQKQRHLVTRHPSLHILPYAATNSSSIMPGPATVLSLNITGTDNEKILMRVSVPRQTLGANRPSLTERKDRDERGGELMRWNAHVCLHVSECACFCEWVEEMRKRARNEGRGSVLIEDDHTYNIFLGVKQAEWTSLPPTHACRTSRGACSFPNGFAVFSLSLFHRQLEIDSPRIPFKQDTWNNAGDNLIVRHCNTGQCLCLVFFTQYKQFYNFSANKSVGCWVNGYNG